MSKQPATLQDSLSAWAEDVRERAAKTASGQENDDLIKKIAEADKSPELYNWINSPELQPPK